jgi:hypothetical protein
MAATTARMVSETTTSISVKPGAQRAAEFSRVPSWRIGGRLRYPLRPRFQLPMSSALSTPSGPSE